MPLLTTIQKTNAEIAALGQSIASHLAAAANAANKQAQAVLALSSADLADWLNHQGDDLETLLTAHSVLGEAINTASATAHGIMETSGIIVPLGTVDIRPVPEKLEDQNREIVMTEQGANVIDIPQPEPETES
jgi:hypothetical protein